MGICGGAGRQTTNRDQSVSASLSWKQRFNLEARKEEKGGGKTEIQQTENWKETGKQQKENTAVTWWPRASSQILVLTLSAKEDIGRVVEMN